MKSRLLVAAISLNAVGFVAAWYVLLAPRYEMTAKTWALMAIFLTMLVNRRLLCAYVDNRSASSVTQLAPPDSI